MKPPGKLAGPRLRKLGSLLLNVAVIAGVFAAVSAFQARNMLAADRQPAPELQLVTLEGTPYALADLRRGAASARRAPTTLHACADCARRTDSKY
jgi:hypothetical protein